VFLGSLALQRSHSHSNLGSLISFVGIFLPGLTLAIAVQSFWQVLRKGNGSWIMLRP
jgi:hypothetical protein